MCYRNCAAFKRWGRKEPFLLSSHLFQPLGSVGSAVTRRSGVSLHHPVLNCVTSHRAPTSFPRNLEASVPLCVPLSKRKKKDCYATKSCPQFLGQTRGSRKILPLGWDISKSATAHNVREAYGVSVFLALTFTFTFPTAKFLCKKNT